MNEFEQHMKDQEEMEKEMVLKARENMKKELVDKAQCMIDSYNLVLNSTANMFRSSQARNVTDSEIVTRTDMFWNMSLQRIDMEDQEAKRLSEKRQHEYTHVHGSGQVVTAMPQGQPMHDQSIPVRKSPCQERAERDAKKIAELEAEKSKTIEAETVK